MECHTASLTDTGGARASSVPEASVSLIWERQADSVEHCRSEVPHRGQEPVEVQLGACTALLGRQLCLISFPISVLSHSIFS